jgi:hypothetical protein
MNAMNIALLYLILFFVLKRMLMKKPFFAESCTLLGLIYDFQKTHINIFIHTVVVGQWFLITFPILVILIFRYFKHNISIISRSY